MIALVPSPLFAAPTKVDIDRAETLFVEARGLMEAGRYAEACPRLVEAQRLDPGGGTLLALALCHEGEGRGATALAEFREARKLAEQANRSDRIELADTHLKKLEAQVSRVIITPLGPEVEGLSIVFDQLALSKAQWGATIFVDAGAHLVVAGAPGRKGWSTTVNVSGYGDVKRVAVPILEPVAESKPPIDLPSGGSGTITAGYLTLGLGAVAIGVGTYFGFRTLSKTRQYKDVCPNGVCVDQHGIDLNADAKRSGTVSTIAMGVGAVSVASAIVLFLSAPSPESKLKSSAMITPTGVALSFGADF